MISFLRKKAGWLTILLLALLPVLRWIAIAPLNYRFFDLSATMTSFGQITGLAGMAMFSISLILSARLKFLDKYFYGLDKVYKYHHAIGAFSFSLLLFHPLFLVFRYIQFSLRDAALFFLPSSDLARNFGIVSLFFMIILMVLTFYIRLKYQSWKLSHKFLVFVFAFAVLHSVYAASDVSRDDILRFYILGLAFLGLAAGFWRAFLHKYFNRNFVYEVKKVAKANRDVVEIEMSPKAGMMHFEAGQFIFASFENKEIGAEIHSFSMTSAEGEENLKIAVKVLGDYTGKIKNLNIGDKVSVEGPFGKFSYKNVPGKSQIWVAGGIGITPFLSMARSLKDDGYEIDLFYSVNNPEDAVFADELSKISSIHKNFKLFAWYSRESGRLNGEIIAELSSGVLDKEIFICGPLAFMESLSGQFVKIGVKKEKIHWENFNFK